MCLFKLLNCQKFNENRTIEESLDLGWKLLSILPRTELNRVSGKTLDEFYVENKDVFKTQGTSKPDEDDDDLEDS